MEAEVYGMSKIKVTTTQAGTLNVFRGNVLVLTQSVSKGTTTVKVPSVPSANTVQYNAQLSDGGALLEKATFYLGFGDTKEVSLDPNAINSDFVVVGDGLVKSGNIIKHTKRTATTRGSGTQIPVITTDETGHVTGLSAASIPTSYAIDATTNYTTAGAVKTYVDTKMSMISSNFKVERIVPPNNSWSHAGSGKIKCEYNISRSGYKVLGVVGYSFSTNFYSLTDIVEISAQTGTLKVQAYKDELPSSTVSSYFYVDVLYVK